MVLIGIQQRLTEPCDLRLDLLDVLLLLLDDPVVLINTGSRLDQGIIENGLRTDLRLRHHGCGLFISLLAGGTGIVIGILHRLFSLFLGIPDQSLGSDLGGDNGVLHALGIFLMLEQPGIHLLDPQLQLSVGDLQVPDLLDHAVHKIIDIIRFIAAES